MSFRSRSELAALQEKAGDVAELMKILANEQRLLVLCRLAIDDEVSVGEIAESVDLGQSALSQHLARMREEGLIAARKDGLSVFYRIADDSLAELLGALKSIYCPTEKRKNDRVSIARTGRGIASKRSAARRHS